MNDVSVADTRYEDRYFTVADGLRLHYRDYPGSSDRSPLLCLPGLTRNSRDFAEFGERYSPRFRVIALDIRGRGMSEYDPVPARYLPPVYAQDVIDLLEELSIPQAVFVGTSLGGLVTMAVAVMKPQQIKAAILNDVGPVINDVGVERIKSYVGTGQRFRDWDEAGETIARNVQSFDNFSHDDWVRMAKRNCREENGEIVFDYDPAIAEPFSTEQSEPRPDLWPFFSALAQKPLLVVRGEHSDLLSADTLERMHEAAPNMCSVVVAGVGHAPELSEPEAAAAIDSFLNDVD
jgi:pimeloyl-ACP methyl ester carboxylesterase